MLIFLFSKGWELANGQDPECLGIFYGLIGRIRLADCDDRLLLIKECATVGTLPSGHVVNAITSIAILQPTAQVHLHITKDKNCFFFLT